MRHSPEPSTSRKHRLVTCTRQRLSSLAMTCSAGPHCEGHHRCNDVDLVKSMDAGGQRGRRTCTAVDVPLVTDLYRLETTRGWHTMPAQPAQLGCCALSTNATVFRCDSSSSRRSTSSGAATAADRRNRFNNGRSALTNLPSGEIQHSSRRHLSQPAGARAQELSRPNNRGTPGRFVARVRSPMKNQQAGPQ